MNPTKFKSKHSHFHSRHLKMSTAKCWLGKFHLNMDSWGLIDDTESLDEITLWASYQIRTIAGCACTGNAGNVFLRRRLQRKPLVAISACITARVSRTCRDACRDRIPAVAVKTFPAFPAHAHKQFFVSGKRPMAWQGVRHKPLPNPVITKFTSCYVINSLWSFDAICCKHFGKHVGKHWFR